MAITLRNIKGEELSYEELDNNFIDLNIRLQDLENNVTSQTLALFDNTLVISNGNSVDLSPFLPFSGDYGDLTNTPAIPSLISQLQDVSTTIPQTGQVLKWNGSQWAPDTDDSNITDGADADTLNGQLPTYYLNYNNFVNTPVVASTLGELTDVSSAQPSSGQVLKWNGSLWAPAQDLTAGIQLTDLSVGADNGASGAGGVSYDNTSGVFTYTPPIIPATLTDLGISEGQPGQFLQTDGAGTYTFTTVQAAAASLTLNDLSNVDTSGEVNGSILKFNGTNWVVGVDESSGVSSVAFEDLTSTPTTIAGYGITDAFDGAFSSLSGTPTTIAGYGITDAFDGAFGSLSGTPTTLSGYGITDALASTAIGDFTFSGTTLDTAASAAITVTPDVTFSGTVTVSSFASAGVGNFSVSSAASVNITAVDDINFTATTVDFTGTTVTGLPTANNGGVAYQYGYSAHDAVSTAGNDFSVNSTTMTVSVTATNLAQGARIDISGITSNTSAGTGLIYVQRRVNTGSWSVWNAFIVSGAGDHFSHSFVDFYDTGGTQFDVSAGDTVEYKLTNGTDNSSYNGNSSGAVDFELFFGFQFTATEIPVSYSLTQP
jgi:hypothetical protein